MTELPQVSAPRCMHLMCKAMMVYGEAFESDPDYQAGLSDFWCVMTSKGFGPDDQEVGMEVCYNPQRSCYREY